jgi:hypothetical protein
MDCAGLILEFNLLEYALEHLIKPEAGVFAGNFFPAKTYVSKKI